MSNKRRKIGEDYSSGIFGHLPNDIIECILYKLPIQDAAKTMVLSKDWRDKWLSWQSFIFKVKDMEGCFLSFPPSKIADELAKVINKILSKHEGQIHMFELHGCRVQQSLNIDRWMTYLSEHGIKDLALRQEPNGERYLLKSQLFSVQSLRSLDLREIRIESSPEFDGFNCLVSLDLVNVTMKIEVFECIMAKCPLLASLFLFKVDGLDTLNLLSPKLKKLRFRGSLHNLCVKSDKLLDMSIFPLKSFRIIDKIVQQKRLADCRLWLSQTWILRGGSHLLEFLDFGSLDKNPHFTFANLHILKFYNLCFHKLDNVSSLLRLIRSSPNLKRLLVVMANRSSPGSIEPVIEYFRKEDYTRDEFLKLRYVELEKISGKKHIMDFIKFILAKSPDLQSLTVEPSQKCQSEEINSISSDVTKLRRSSQHANVIVLTNKYPSELHRFKQLMS